MTRAPREGTRWLMVVVFAIAMAWVEAACVYYLRLHVDRVQPYQLDPLPIDGAIGGVELVREAATLIMFAMVGALAGRTRTTRLAYTAVGFGAWDIFYYVFLQMMSGWPASLWDWDILFLLPLPWWGPVIAPVAIAALMVVGGTVASQRESTIPETAMTRWLWRAGCVGVVLALYVFMADALRDVRQGSMTVGRGLPTSFNWPVYLVALALMAAPVVWMIRSRFRD